MAADAGKELFFIDVSGDLLENVLGGVFRKEVKKMEVKKWDELRLNGNELVATNSLPFVTIQSEHWKSNTVKFAFILFDFQCQRDSNYRFDQFF